jgi:hypothetical protein
VVGHFRRWYKRWRWEARALAWDEEVAALARDQELDRALQARLAEQAEDLRQRTLMREEARAARAVARQLLRRMLKEVESGQLERMSASQLLPHLQKISALLETGQKLDRLFAGEPTDVTRQEVDTRETVRKLAQIMRDFCPPERWDELGARLDELDATGAA